MPYIWNCAWENDASDWKDSERCTARSRKKFISKIDAYNAGMKHADKHPGLANRIWVTQIHGNKKWK